MKVRIQPEAPQHGPHYKMAKRFLRWGLTVLVVVIATVKLVSVCRFYYVAEELPPYTISQPRHQDDTLRMIIIGDSWADYHTSLQADTMIANTAKRIYSHPVKSISRGKRGAQSKEIYYFMFSEKTTEHSYEPDRCTQPLIEDHPDYCVVFAGINDVTFMKPTSYYAKNMKHIIRLLLHNGIKPVVMEIPLVHFKYPYKGMRLRDKLYYWTTSALLSTLHNKGEDYQEALNKILSDTHLKDSVLYIAAKQWNPKGSIDTTMFLSDRLHLNLAGYQKLDSCIITEIIHDYHKRSHNPTHQ
jgi:hypothetical protein